MAYLPRYIQRIRLFTIAQHQQRAEREPPIPVDTLFFLNTLPRQLDVRYVILADGIIEADKVVMA